MKTNKKMQMKDDPPPNLEALTALVLSKRDPAQWFSVAIGHDGTMLNYAKGKTIREAEAGAEALIVVQHELATMPPDSPDDIPSEMLVPEEVMESRAKWMLHAPERLLSSKDHLALLKAMQDWFQSQGISDGDAVIAACRYGAVGIASFATDKADLRRKLKEAAKMFAYTARQQFEEEEKDGLRTRG